MNTDEIDPRLQAIINASDRARSQLLDSIQESLNGGTVIFVSLSEVSKAYPLSEWHLDYPIIAAVDNRTLGANIVSAGLRLSYISGADLLTTGYEFTR